MVSCRGGTVQKGGMEVKTVGDERTEGGRRMGNSRLQEFRRREKRRNAKKDSETGTRTVYQLRITYK